MASKWPRRGGFQLKAEKREKEQLSLILQHDGSTAACPARRPARLLQKYRFYGAECGCKANTGGSSGHIPGRPVQP